MVVCLSQILGYRDFYRDQKPNELNGLKSKIYRKRDIAEWLKPLSDWPVKVEQGERPKQGLQLRHGQLSMRQVPFPYHRSRAVTLRAACIVAALGGAAVPAAAACSKTIAIIETQQMNYGTIAVTSGGGTVTVAANGTVSAPGGFVLSGATAAGGFHVTGDRDLLELVK